MLSGGFFVGKIYTGESMFTATSRINIKTEKLQTLMESVRKGLPIKYALERSGIPGWYYYTWLKLYNEFISQKEQEGNFIDDIDELEPEPYYDKDGKIKGYYYTPISIIDNLKQCYAEWVVEKYEQVNSGIKDNWQSAAWLLERRVRSEYAKDEPQETKEKVESISVVYVDPNESKNRLEKLEKEVKDNVGGN